MCCCFGSRGEHVEPVKKIPQHEVEKKKLQESNGRRVPVPSELYKRDPSRGSSTSRNGNRGSQSGHSSSSSSSSSSKDPRGYNSNGDSHRYSNGGYGQEGHTQGGRAPPSFGTRALGTGLDTSRYTSAGSDYRR
ncbi:uncharacterized protein EAF01_005780 [Botrytis porri]|uniref:uncharacterized protein n=1 Tax=Botrytis porri TaxID=87229 RepID=UPI001901D26E|nr:uncharacterized protein EAF01_005780 [Botrytis porri]KAF7905259.1 hypothetical protein EAF01_005780 [Botrytis porri]